MSGRTEGGATSAVGSRGSQAIAPQITCRVIADS
jgi:hypothetical protein